MAAAKNNKVLIVGNYPPPMCGWAMQTFLVVAELRRRGDVCDVLKINEGRRTRTPDYVDVQGGWDFARKVIRFTLGGYHVNVHVNGTSRKGYALALFTTLIGRLALRPASLTFHGGLSQTFFPRHDSRPLFLAFRLLFQSAGRIACDSTDIKDAIAAYGIPPGKITAIATFSPQYLQFTPVPLGGEVEEFLSAHDPVIFCYVAFRPEYRLDVVRRGMSLLREKYPRAGIVWLGFPEGEMPSARAFVEPWPAVERSSLLLIGNLTHDEFLTLLTRSTLYLRSPACDGVAASVLEALACGIPVVASENGRRPAGVITYRDEDAADMCARMINAMEQRDANAATGRAPGNADCLEDNVALMADWLTLAGQRRAGAS